MRPRKSTKMVLDRKATIRHECGQSVQFEPDVPVGVPPRMVKMAIGIGAKIIDGDAPKEVEQKGPNFGPEDPEDRQEEIVKVIQAMIEEDNRDDWTGTGTPNVGKVSQQLGWKVQKQEVVEAFQTATANEPPPEEHTGSE